MNEHIIHINRREKTEGLRAIEEAIHEFKSAGESELNERGVAVLEAIRAGIITGERFIVPVEIDPAALGISDDDPPQPGQLLDIPKDMNIATRALQHEDGSMEFVVFTNQGELEAGSPTSSMTERIDVFLDQVMKNSSVDGLVINPWGEAFFLSKFHIHKIFEGNIPCEYENILHFSTADPEGVGVARIVDGGQEKKHYWDILEQARLDGIHSIAFREPEEGEMKVALGMVVDWMKINPHHPMAIMFSCTSEEMAGQYRTEWDSLCETWDERPIVRENNGDLERAMAMAMSAHKGMNRKGKETPYILHPIETLQILASMNADTNLMVAGILHDTVEDTDLKLWDIYEQFGVDVAALVQSHTENKSEVWYMRKLRKIEELPKVILREKMLTIADKVSNLRSMYRDYKIVGDELWERFNAPKHLQAWYYGGLNDGLAELQEYPETADVYWEMTGLYKDLFVDFLLDGENETLYQISASGESYVLKKAGGGWDVLNHSIPENAELISRREAEWIADHWVTA